MRELAIRPYHDDDEAEVLALLAASLGKTVDERYRQFFRWKHLGNPAGRSFMWVAHLDGVLAGFRAFMRWRFVTPAGDRVEAVRAVDTATSPLHRGAGVFRELTMHGLTEMRPHGISFVFNTPNDQSRPGYLKMGWAVEGRVAIKVRPASLGAIATMARARTPAETWSLPADVGMPIDQVDGSLLEMDRPAHRQGLATERTPRFLRWRYGGCPTVASVVLPHADGAVLIRFRQRGPAVEAVIGDVVGAVTPRAAGAVAQTAARQAGADYLLAAASTPISGMVRASRLGPIQTRRAVADEGCALPLALALGDVELF